MDILIIQGRYTEFAMLGANRIIGGGDIFIKDLKGFQYNKEASQILALVDYFEENTEANEVLFVPKDCFILDLDLKDYETPCKTKKDFDSNLPIVVQRSFLIELKNQPHWNAIHPADYWRNQYAKIAELEGKKTKEITLNGVMDIHKPLEKIKGFAVFSLKDPFGPVEDFLNTVYGNS